MSRLGNAWRAFWERPDDTWVVAHYAPPVGLRILYDSRSEAAAQDWNKRNGYGLDERGVERSSVMTLARWRRLQCDYAASSTPWVQLGQLSREMAAMRRALHEARLVGLGVAADRDIERTGAIPVVSDPSGRL